MTCWPGPKRAQAGPRPIPIDKQFGVGPSGPGLLRINKTVWWSYLFVGMVISHEDLNFEFCAPHRNNQKRLEFEFICSLSRGQHSVEIECDLAKVSW